MAIFSDGSAYEKDRNESPCFSDVRTGRRGLTARGEVIVTRRHNMIVFGLIHKRYSFLYVVSSLCQQGR